MRTARQNVPGVFYHLIWRFVDRQWFFHDDDDRETYLRFVGRALADSDWRSVSYAVMSNHLHHGLIAGHEPLWAWAKRAHSPFARWMNTRHGRLGPVMADRPKDLAIRPDREPYVIAYIHNNPVRAGVVANARDSTWTSHRAYAGLVAPPTWLHVAGGIQRTGIVDFDAWVGTTPGESGEVDSAEVRLEVHRRGAIEIGTPLAGAQPCFPLVRRPFGHLRVDPRRVLQIAAYAVGVSERDVASRKRNTAVVSARLVAIHCGRALGLTGSDLASVLALSPAGVSQIGRRLPNVEQARAIQVATARLEIEIAPTSEDRPSTMPQLQRVRRHK